MLPCISQTNSPFIRMVRWHRWFLVQKDKKQDFRSRSGCSSMTIFRKPVLHTHDSKQMEESYLDGEGTNIMFRTPAFQMLLSLLMICAVLGKTPAAKSTKYHHHLKWCGHQAFNQNNFLWSSRKENTVALSSFVSFKQQHHPKIKPLVPRDNIAAWVQRGKHWSVNPHLSTTPTVTSWAAWLLGSVSVRHFHVHSMDGCNYAFCIPQQPMMKATLLLKYLWCSGSESLSLSFLSEKWG